MEETLNYHFNKLLEHPYLENYSEEQKAVLLQFFASGFNLGIEFSMERLLLKNNLDGKPKTFSAN